MASFKLGLFLLASIFAVLFLSGPVEGKDKEESVLKGINSYRETLRLPVLNQSDKASCLANEVADELEHEPCENVNQYYPSSPGPAASANPNIPNLVRHADKCDIDINSTIDGVILPVCVAKLEPAVVVSNYTHDDRYKQFVNNSKYTGVGLSSEDDWMVLVLTTNTPAGSFTSSANALIGNSSYCSFCFFYCTDPLYLDSASALLFRKL